MTQTMARVANLPPFYFRMYKSNVGIYATPSVTVYICRIHHNRTMLNIFKMYSKCNLHAATTQYNRVMLTIAGIYTARVEIWHRSVWIWLKSKRRQVTQSPTTVYTHCNSLEMPPVGRLKITKVQISLASPSRLFIWCWVCIGWAASSQAKCSPACVQPAVPFQDVSPRTPCHRKKQPSCQFKCPSRALPRTVCCLVICSTLMRYFFQWMHNRSHSFPPTPHLFLTHSS